MAASAVVILIAGSRFAVFSSCRVAYQYYRAVTPSFLVLLSKSSGSDVSSAAHKRR